MGKSREEQLLEQVVGSYNAHVGQKDISPTISPNSKGTVNPTEVSENFAVVFKEYASMYNALQLAAKNLGITVPKNEGRPDLVTVIANIKQSAQPNRAWADAMQNATNATQNYQQQFRAVSTALTPNTEKPNSEGFDKPAVQKALDEAIVAMHDAAKTIAISLPKLQRETGDSYLLQTEAACRTFIEQGLYAQHVQKLNPADPQFLDKVATFNAIRTIDCDLMDSIFNLGTDRSYKQSVAQITTTIEDKARIYLDTQTESDRELLETVFENEIISEAAFKRATNAYNRITNKIVGVETRTTLPMTAYQENIGAQYHAIQDKFEHPIVPQVFAPTEVAEQYHIGAPQPELITLDSEDLQKLGGGLDSLAKE